YMEKHAVSRLVGSPPGYVGYDEGGQLTEQVRRKPYSVILLDEIEKAHPEVFNILLQILEDGRLTDAQGRQVDFRHAIVIMTSNIGASTITRSTPLGFSVAEEGGGMDYDDMKSRIMGELKKVFRPELINRIDEIIVFHQLSKDEIKQIIDLMLVRLQQQLAEQGVSIQLTDAAKDLLVEEGIEVVLASRFSGTGRPRRPVPAGWPCRSMQWGLWELQRQTPTATSWGGKLFGRTAVPRLKPGMLAAIDTATTAGTHDAQRLKSLRARLGGQVSAGRLIMASLGELPALVSGGDSRQTPGSILRAA
ncbi:hypothetical protein EBU58_15295, partial [bacterium]|nr:hypothetical protein [bacterium]